MKLKDFPNHHAILFVNNDRSNFGNAIWDEIISLSPANIFFNKTILDIETARGIISWANAPWNGEKIALVSFHTASIPAQNAMLKILEEPKENVRFILLTSNREKLLDTVLSRMIEVKTRDIRQRTTENTNAEKFLQTSNTSRMKLPFINDLLNREDEEKRKDRESIKSFILSLSSVLSTKNPKPKYTKEILKMASYSADSSISGKTLIEYLSLLLPQIK